MTVIVLVPPARHWIVCGWHLWFFEKAVREMHGPKTMTEALMRLDEIQRREQAGRREAQAGKRDALLRKN